jgi:hypothetical protein
MLLCPLLLLPHPIHLLMVSHCGVYVASLSYICPVAPFPVAQPIVMTLCSLLNQL